MNPELHKTWAAERVDAYLDGDLSERDRATFEAVLAESDGLRTELAMARRIQSALRALPERDAPAAVLAAAKREAVTTTTFEETRRRPLWPWTTALAAAAAVLMTVAVLRDVRAPDPTAPVNTGPTFAQVAAPEPTAEELAIARGELMSTFAYLGAVQQRGATAAGTAVFDKNVSPALRTAFDALGVQPNLLQPPDEPGKEMES